jgi:hypothetical protein
VSRGPVRAVTALLIAFLVLFAAACGGRRVEEPLRGELEFPAGVRTVRVRVASGGVTITTLPADAGRITYDVNTLRAGLDKTVLAELERIDLRPTARLVEPGVLLVEAAALPARFAVDPARDSLLDPNRFNAIVVKGTYGVPQGVDVEIDTGRGPIAVLGREASVTVHTGGGDVRLDRVDGPARIRTDNGTVLVDEHRGALDVETGRGDVFVWVYDVTEPGLVLRTRFGNVQAEVPTSLEFDLELRARRGEVTNGFGLEVQEPAEHEVGCKGRIGAGTLPVRIATAHGNASIRANDRLDRGSDR